MLDLLGKATFTAEQISAMRSALDQYGLPMPQFRRIGGKSLFLKYRTRAKKGRSNFAS